MHKKRIPMRMCTGCGEMKPKPELVRVVKAPDQKDEQGNILAAGEISLDATGKKPGRGAYVCKKADCLKAARKSRSQNKLLSLLGIARRAGRLSLGNDPALEAMRNGQTCVILVANDLSKRTLKGVCFAAEEAHIDVLTMNETMDEIGAALGKRTGVIAVNDAGFANKMRTMCSETDNQQKNEEE